MGDSRAWINKLKLAVLKSEPACRDPIALWRRSEKSIWLEIAGLDVDDEHDQKYWLNNSYVLAYSQ